jgi:hypothetical protein
MTGRAQLSSTTRNIANPAIVSSLAPSRALRTLQREANGARAHDGATAMVRNVLSGPGRPLDRCARSQIEPRLGYDFSRVRVHDDPSAADSARAIGANAYTAGEHIVFGQDRYAPQTRGGQRLLAHELTHVVQQAQGSVAGSPIGGGFAVSSPDDAFERHAAANALAFDAVAPHATDLRRLPNTDDAYNLQRDGSDGWAIAGTIAGIAGAALAAAALIFAILAWRRPANPATTVGGISLNTQPISASDPDPAGIPENRREAAIAAPTRTEKLFDLRTDGDNHADVNVDVATDGVSIFSAAPQPAAHGYNGGTGGSSAAITFGAPSTITVPKYDRRPPAPAPRAARSGHGGRQGGGAAAQQQPLAPNDTGGVVQVPFNGQNSVGEKEPVQQFAGKMVIRAHPATGGHTVECVECTARNQVGSASVDDHKIGHIDYRGHAAAPPNPEPTPAPAPAPEHAAPTPPPSGGR